MQKLSGEAFHRDALIRQLVFQGRIDRDPFRIVAAVPIDVASTGLIDQVSERRIRFAAVQNESAADAIQIRLKAFQRMMQPPALRGTQWPIFTVCRFADINGNDIATGLRSGMQGMVIAEPQVLAKPDDNRSA